MLGTPAYRAYVGIFLLQVNLAGTCSFLQPPNPSQPDPFDQTPQLSQPWSFSTFSPNNVLDFFNRGPLFCLSVGVFYFLPFQ